MKNYSKRLIDVIEYSREEAARLQNSYIGPEHLMLGIIPIRWILNARLSKK